MYVKKDVAGDAAAADKSINPFDNLNVNATVFIPKEEKAQPNTISDDKKDSNGAVK